MNFVPSKEFSTRVPCLEFALWLCSTRNAPIDFLKCHVLPSRTKRITVFVTHPFPVVFPFLASHISGEDLEEVCLFHLQRRRLCQLTQERWAQQAISLTDSILPILCQTVHSPQWEPAHHPLLTCIPKFLPARYEPHHPRHPHRSNIGIPIYTNYNYANLPNSKDTVDKSQLICIGRFCNE